MTSVTKPAVNVARVSTYCFVIDMGVQVRTLFLQARTPERLPRRGPLIVLVLVGPDPGV